MSARELRAKAEGLQVPLSAATLLAGMLVAFHTALGAGLAPGALLPSLALLATVLLASTFAAQARAMRRAPVLRSLGRDLLAPGKPELLAAISEASRLPDAIFIAALEQWAAVACLLAPALALLGELPWATALRVAGAALACGPLAAALACVFTTQSCREVLRAASSGLSLAELLQAVPRRRQLTPRLIALCAIIVVTPALMTAELCHTLFRRGLEEVLRLPESGAQGGALGRLWIEATTSVGALLGLVSLIVGLGVWSAGTALRRPLHEIARSARRIMQGKLQRSSIIPAEDEIWEVSAAFCALQAHLTEVLARLKQAGAEISGTSAQMVVTSRTVQLQAKEQATTLDQTSATTEELAQSARHISRSAGEVAAIAGQTFDAAQGGMRSAEAFVRAMGWMREINHGIAQMVQRLDKHVLQIGDLVQHINAMADKSDLLALSAELESTRAGGLGQGIYQVAGEVRLLGQTMMRSTREVARMIEEVRLATSAAVTATEGGVRATEAGTELAAQISERLSAIVTLAGQTAAAAQTISLASQQQELGTGQVASSMADILRITEDSLAATRQFTAANLALSQVTGEIQGVVGRFELS